MIPLIQHLHRHFIEQWSDKTTVGMGVVMVSAGLEWATRLLGLAAVIVGIYCSIENLKLKRREFDHRAAGGKHP